MVMLRLFKNQGIPCTNKIFKFNSFDKHTVGNVPSMMQSGPPDLIPTSPRKRVTCYYCHLLIIMNNLYFASSQFLTFIRFPT